MPLIKPEISLFKFPGYPIEKDLDCKISPKIQINKIQVSGLPNKLWLTEKNKNNNIPNFFFIKALSGKVKMWQKCGKK